MDVFSYRDSAPVSLAPSNSGSVFETDKVSQLMDQVLLAALGHFRSSSLFNSSDDM